MIDPLKVFKYYLSIKLHFTNEKFDVFKNRGNIRTSSTKFNQRNDKKIFEKISRLYPNDKQCILFFASNFLYNHKNVLYDLNKSIDNYQKYLKIKQSITYTLINDIETILNVDTDIFSLYLTNKISLETLCIVNDYYDNCFEHHPAKPLFQHIFLAIKKSKGFIHYDKSKIDPIFSSDVVRNTLELEFNQNSKTSQVLAH